MRPELPQPILGSTSRVESRGGFHDEPGFSFYTLTTLLFGIKILNMDINIKSVNNFILGL